MALEDGANLINQAYANVLAIQIPQFSNLSISDLLLFGTFVSIIAWFSARMIKGKSHNELAVQSEGIPEDSLSGTEGHMTQEDRRRDQGIDISGEEL